MWTKPDDLSVDPKEPSRGLARPGQDGFPVLLADGSTRYMSGNIESKTLNALFTRSGGEAVALPPDEAERNDLGLLGPRGPAMPKWQSVAGDEAETPLGWPILWTALALCLLPAAWRRRLDPPGSLALSLLASVLVLEASFLLISIASDLRYHLWPMMASALALILLSDGLALTRREWIGTSVAMTLVIGGGVISRNSLPPAPETYEGMIHAVSG